MKFRDCNDAVLVSRMAAALCPLPDAWLPTFALREAAYPARLIAACGADFERFDRAALHAETARRALRVGRGYAKQGVAA